MFKVNDIVDIIPENYEDYADKLENTYYRCKIVKIHNMGNNVVYRVKFSNGRIKNCKESEIKITCKSH